MATVEWTDARLNVAFDALRKDNALLREEMREMRAEMRSEFRAIRDEFRGEMRAMREEHRADMNTLADRVHSDLRLMWATIIGTYASFVAAFVATQL
jgi:ribosome-associated toxin RatA of RatAB toxin-antitoxin module